MMVLLIPIIKHKSQKSGVYSLHCSPDAHSGGNFPLLHLFTVISCMYSAKASDLVLSSNIKSLLFDHHVSPDLTSLSRPRESAPWLHNSQPGILAALCKLLRVRTALKVVCSVLYVCNWPSNMLCSTCF